MRKLLTTTRNKAVDKAPSASLGLLNVLKVRRRPAWHPALSSQSFMKEDGTICVVDTDVKK
ncbi:hypothetical protein [Phascolarctobacterium sp.]